MNKLNRAKVMSKKVTVINLESLHFIHGTVQQLELLETVKEGEKK